MHWKNGQMKNMENSVPEPTGDPQNRHIHIHERENKIIHERLQFWLMQTRFGCLGIIEKCSVGFRILGKTMVKSVQMHYLLHPHGKQNTFNSTAMRVIPYKPHSYAFTVCLTG